MAEILYLGKKASGELALLLVASSVFVIRLYLALKM